MDLSPVCPTVLCLRSDRINDGAQTGLFWLSGGRTHTHTLTLTSHVHAARGWIPPKARQNDRRVRPHLCVTLTCDRPLGDTDPSSAQLSPLGRRRCRLWGLPGGCQGGGDRKVSRAPARVLGPTGDNVTDPRCALRGEPRAPWRHKSPHHPSGTQGEL